MSSTQPNQLDVVDALVSIGHIRSLLPSVLSPLIHACGRVGHTQTMCKPSVNGPGLKKWKMGTVVRTQNYSLRIRLVKGVSIFGHVKEDTVEML